MNRRTPLAVILAAASLAIPLVASTAPSQATPVPPPPVGVRDDLGGGMSQPTDTIIVRFDQGQADPAKAAEQAVERAADTQVTQVTPITPSMAAVTVDEQLTAGESQRLGEQVEAQPGVDTAEPAGTFTSATTNDRYYSYLWNVASPSKSGFGTNAEAAWASATGKGAVIGVVDTGITPHRDLTGSTVAIVGGNVVAGYDFLSSPATAGDGNGRDSDPRDVGNYCDGEGSTWHGTHVAGIAAAIRDNAIGVAGVAPGAKVQPLRALGRCGGPEADIISAMRWGAGLPVSGIAAVNPTPVSVLNLSLGGTGTCSSAMQSTVDAIIAKGIPIVVSAGNDDKAVSTATPANCRNVIRVGASTFTGTLASYSNYGDSSVPLTISGPGGAGNSDDMSAWIVSTYNTGSTTPVAESYMGMVGTSMAAPHVAGVAALLKSKDPGLAPAQIQAILAATATPIPGCAVSRCGAGVVNAAKAVAALLGNPVNSLAVTLTGVPFVGNTLTAQAAGATGATLAYQWLRNDTPIAGATSATYTMVKADAGAKLSVKVTATYVGMSASKASTAATVYASLADSIQLPAITGDPMVGGTLMNATPAAPLGTETFKWFRDGVMLNLTAKSLKVGSADLGHQYVVSRTVAFNGQETTKTSEPVTIAPNSSADVEVPVITGRPMVGDKLTTAGAGAGDKATYTYQWYRSGKVISRATKSSYTMTSSDLGKSLTVRITAHVLGFSAAKSSLPVTVRPNLVTNLQAPVISGVAKVGQALTTAGAGADGATYTFQWYRSGKAISGATKASRTLTSSDRGKTMTVKVTATYLGQRASKTSSRTGKVGSGTFANTAQPYTTGTCAKGSTLKANAGIWTPTASTVKYRWLRNGSSISGATSSSYKLTSSDRGKSISVRITVYRSGYTTTTSVSVPQLGGNRETPCHSLRNLPGLSD